MRFPDDHFVRFPHRDENHQEDALHFINMDDSINTNLSEANFSTWSRSNISKEWFYESYLNSSSGKKCKQIYTRPKINSFQILIKEELITSALTLQVKLNRINVLVITLKFFNRIVDFLKNVGIRTIGQSLSILAGLRLN